MNQSQFCFIRVNQSILFYTGKKQSSFYTGEQSFFLYTGEQSKLLIPVGEQSKLSSLCFTEQILFALPPDATVPVKTDQPLTANAQ